MTETLHWCIRLDVGALGSICMALNLLNLGSRVLPVRPKALFSWPIAIGLGLVSLACTNVEIWTFFH
jgi:hypothetical protein